MYAALVKQTGKFLLSYFGKYYSSLLFPPQPTFSPPNKFHSKNCATLLVLSLLNQVTRNGKEQQEKPRIITSITYYLLLGETS